MSSKKTKTKAEKINTRHRLDHLASNTLVVRSTEATTKVDTRVSVSKSPQDSYIRKDLKNTLLTIAVFSLLVIVLAALTYTTGFLNPLLSNWHIKY